MVILSGTGSLSLLLPISLLQCPSDFFHSSGTQQVVTSCEEVHRYLVRSRGSKERVPTVVLHDPYNIGLYLSLPDFIGSGTKTGRIPYIVELNLSLTDPVGSETRRQGIFVLQEVSKRVTVPEFTYWVPSDEKPQGVDTTFTPYVSVLTQEGPVERTRNP